MPITCPECSMKIRRNCPSMIRYRMTCPSRSQNLPPGTQILLILWLQVMYHQGRIKGSLSTKVVSTYRMNRTSFRVCSDGLLRRCVPVDEGIKIIERCHSSPYGGHYGASALIQKSGKVDSFGQPCMKT